MIVLPNLEQVLKYENCNIIKRFNKEFSQSSLTAEEALANLIKYFWLCRKHELDKANNPHDESLQFECCIHTEMTDIDNMWHTFLLFTRDYHDFCSKYFFKFIHHVPNTGEHKLSREEFVIDFTLYLSYIYDNLGEDTLRQWFAEHLKEHDR